MMALVISDPVPIPIPMPRITNGWGEYVRRLDGIDIDDIGNLEDLLRIVFIHEELTRNGELTININKKRPDVLQACRCSLCNKFYRREYFFSKHVEYCESAR